MLRVSTTWSKFWIDGELIFHEIAFNTNFIRLKFRKIGIQNELRDSCTVYIIHCSMSSMCLPNEIQRTIIREISKEWQKYASTAINTGNVYGCCWIWARAPPWNIQCICYLPVRSTFGMKMWTTHHMARKKIHVHKWISQKPTQNKWNSNLNSQYSQKMRFLLQLSMFKGAKAASTNNMLRFIYGFYARKHKGIVTNS